MAASLVALVLASGLAGCGGKDSPQTLPEPFSSGGREEISSLGVCLVYLVSGSAGGGDQVRVTDPAVEVTVLEDCYDKTTPKDLASLSIRQVWAGNTGDAPPRTTYQHGSSFHQSNSGMSPVVPASGHDDTGRPCMLVTLLVEVQVDGTSDTFEKALEPCAGTQT